MRRVEVIIVLEPVLAVLHTHREPKYAITDMCTFVCPVTPVVDVLYADSVRWWARQQGYAASTLSKLCTGIRGKIRKQFNNGIKYIQYQLKVHLFAELGSIEIYLCI